MFIILMMKCQTILTSKMVKENLILCLMIGRVDGRTNFRNGPGGSTTSVGFVTSKYYVTFSGEQDFSLMTIRRKTTTNTN